MALENFRQKQGFLVAGTMMESAGKVLRRLDSDNKGADDICGTVAEATGGVFVAVGLGDGSRAKTAISAARTALDVLEEAIGD